MIKLGVNIDHIATLRQARYKDFRPSFALAEPSVLAGALISQEAGADSLTLHLREDRRHIQEEDIFAIKQSDKIKIPLNLEMACNEDVLEIALKLKPDYACLVPEKRQEVSTEGGLDLKSDFEKVNETVEALVANGTLVSIFIDPDLEQIKLASKTKATFIELHTGAFSNDFASEKEFLRLKNSAIFANDLGLKVNAGHGINYQNVSIVKKLDFLNELNIGHSIISRSIFVGLENAVKEMIALIK